MTTRKQKSFTVKRSKWLRGDPDNSYLMDRSGHMCCLGFACNQISRKSKDSLLLARSPQYLFSRKSFLTERGIYSSGAYDNKLAKLAMDINDHRYSSDTTKEKQLTELFADYDIKIKFVD